MRSMRSKFLLLVAGVALAVGAASASFQLYESNQLLRDEMVKRGRFIAQNLAYNAKYGVLTEDKPLLTQLLQGALTASGDPTAGGTGARAGATTDVVGALIRDAKGAVLASQFGQTGDSIRNLPPLPAGKMEEMDTVTDR